MMDDGQIPKARGPRRIWVRCVVGALAAAAIVWSIVALEGWTNGLSVEKIWVGPTPVTVYRPTQAGPAPAVVIAHGFAGSRQLMQPFAVTLAQNGYVAASFDFMGHGRNRSPLAGDVTREDGATAALQGELRRVIAAARTLDGTDGRVAVLGHSMASDIIVREAVADPDIPATIAVSMFSSAVQADAPRNLLIIVGAWEGFLTREALAAVQLSTQANVEPGVQYGQFKDGSARKATLSDNVEHIGVLYSPDSLKEALSWLNATFDRNSDGALDVRGPVLGLLFPAIMALLWAMAALLPRCPRQAFVGPMSGRLFLVACLVPALLTPLILWKAPTSFLPVLVADYLALHFAVYAAINAAMLWWLARPRLGWPRRKLLIVIGAVTLAVIFAIGLPLDAYVASFMPHPGRLPVILALSVGTVLYTLSDEWLVRRPGMPWWAFGTTKMLMCLSLAAAVALNLEKLFFIAIITPVIVLFFVIYGLFSSWIYRQTGHPSVAGIANGLAFAWALGVSFPMLT